MTFLTWVATTPVALEIFTDFAIARQSAVGDRAEVQVMREMFQNLAHKS